LPGLAPLASAETLIRFDDVTEAAGIPSARAAPFITNYASPVLWFDWNEDGWPDLLLGESTGPLRLFINRGDGSGFDEEFHPILADLPGVLALDHLMDGPSGFGAAVPREGFVALTSEMVREAVVVVVRGAAGTFETVPVARPSQALSVVTHGDLDGDGVHELFVTHDVCGLGAATLATLHHLVRGPAGYTAADPAASSDGRFPGSGCWPLPLVTDPDGDGRPSLFVGGDFGSVDKPGYVLHPGSVEEMPAAYTMGIAASDRNDDGQLDYFITSMARDVMWMSSADGRTVEPSGPETEWGYDGPRFKWAAAWLDADNDGDEELWVAAGVLPSGFAVPDASSRDIFVVDGVDRAEEAGVGLETAERTVAIADWDRDGRLDAIVVGLDQRTLFRNVSPEVGHFVAFEVPDEPATRITVEGCGRRWIREWSSGQAGAAHEKLIQVGLGACDSPVRATVTYPWRAPIVLDGLAVDTRHVLPSPGLVWFEPSVATPKQPVRVMSTFKGSVTVGGVAPGGELIAPADMGDHRFEVVVDGARLSLRPRLRVTDVPVDVLVDPWPVHVGDAVQVYAAPASATSGGSPETAAASTFTVTATLPDGAVRATEVAPIPLVDMARSVVEVETTGTEHRVRVLLVDAAGSSPADQLGVVGEVVARLSGGKTASAPLVARFPGWAGASVSSDATSLDVLAFGVLLKTVSLTAPIGPVDPSRSRLWIVQPSLRADGQDVVEVVAWLADADGRSIAPGPELLPSSDGLSPVDTTYREAFLFDGRKAWSVRMVAGTTPGLFTVRVGTGAAQVSERVRLLPAGHAAPDMASSELNSDGGWLVLVPRDPLGQRVGPGVVTVPAFTHVGNGTYLRPAESGLRVTLDEAFWLEMTPSGIRRGVVEPEPSASCAIHTPGRPAPALWGLLLALLTTMFALRGARTSASSTQQYRRGRSRQRLRFDHHE